MTASRPWLGTTVACWLKESDVPHPWRGVGFGRVSGEPRQASRLASRGDIDQRCPMVRGCQSQAGMARPVSGLAGRLPPVSCGLWLAFLCCACGDVHVSFYRYRGLDGSAGAGGAGRVRACAGRPPLDHPVGAGGAGRPRSRYARGRVLRGVLLVGGVRGDSHPDAAGPGRACVARWGAGAGTDGRATPGRRRVDQARPRGTSAQGAAGTVARYPG